MSQKGKAGSILLISVIGYIITIDNPSPVSISGVFNGSLAGVFILGLLNTIFAAAMIGGFADWLAIFALFNKIIFDEHSDILRKKRIELTNAIVDFATKDLLNVGNIKQEVDKLPYSKLLIKYITEYRGREKISFTVQTAIKSILKQVDLCIIVKKIEPDLKKSLREGSIEKLIPKILNTITESEHLLKLYKTVIELGKVIYNEPEFQGILSEHIKKLGEKYDQKSLGRESIRAITLNDSLILNAVNEFSNEKFNHVSLNSNETFGELKTYITKYISSADFIDKLNYNKNEILANDEMLKWIYERINDYQYNNRLEIIKMFDMLVDWGLNEFISNREWQVKFDKFVKEQLNIAVEENHNSLGDMIRKKLELLSDDEIVSIVEKAAGDDIHAIRISGSCVGGAVGAIIYIIGAVFNYVIGGL